MIKFQERAYGAKADIAKGAGIGATLAVGLNKIGRMVLPHRAEIDGAKKLVTAEETWANAMKSSAKVGDKILPKFGDVGKFLSGVNKLFWSRLSELGKWILSNPGKAAVAGAIIGASLAAGYYLLKASYNKASRKLSKVGDHKMLDKVIEALIKMGYKKDVDYTTDPAQADYLKTKVCIVVSSTKDEVGITINSINEPKLEPVARAIIKNLPSGTKFYKRESGVNNELTLAMTESNDGDHTYVASIAERFIRKKYPVFLIEIN